MIEIVAQILAGFFLGVVGLVLAGDFRAWYGRRYPGAGDRGAAALLLLVLYAGALAVIRWVH